MQIFLGIKTIFLKIKSDLYFVNAWAFKMGRPTFKKSQKNYLDYNLEQFVKNS